MKTLLRLTIALLCAAMPGIAQEKAYALYPDRVFDGERMREGWVVVVHAETIAYAGDVAGAGDVDAQRIDLAGTTLMPGLIEGHSHILLHPYNETVWNDQVLKESEAERVARAVNHVRDSLMAGVTTMRDLGSEGAGYADVGVRDAINKGVIPGPRLLVAGKAIVATGSYGPKGFHENVPVPLGAEAADGYDDLVRVVRSQIGRNIDFVKVYADYRWGPGGTAQPSFTQAELENHCRRDRQQRQTGRCACVGQPRRCGVQSWRVSRTIEHGDGGTREIFRLMRERDVALCPTLAAGDAISQYSGWDKGVDPEPARVAAKRASFKAALDAGVTICFGGDVGVYPHGDNVRELEMMVEYGMQTEAVLRAATSVNARLFHIDDEVGRIEPGLIADIIAVGGHPGEDISALRDIEMVMQTGNIVRQ